MDMYGWVGIEEEGGGYFIRRRTMSLAERHADSDFGVFLRRRPILPGLRMTPDVEPAFDELEDELALVDLSSSSFADPAGGRQVMTKATCSKARKGSLLSSSATGSATRALKRRASSARRRTGWMRA